MALSTTSTSLKYLQGWWLSHFLGSLCQWLTTFVGKKFFPISNLKVPWCNLKPFPLIWLLVTLEEGEPHLATSFQAVVRSNKVPLEPPFLQAKHLSSISTSSLAFLHIFPENWGNNEGHSHRAPELQRGEERREETRKNLRVAGLGRVFAMQILCWCVDRGCPKRLLKTAFPFCFLSVAYYFIKKQWL